MKHVQLLLATLLLSTLCCAAEPAATSSATTQGVTPAAAEAISGKDGLTLTTTSEKLSYVLGFRLGQILEALRDELAFNQGIFQRGLDDARQSRQAFTIEQMQPLFRLYRAAMMKSGPALEKAQAQQMREQARAFLNTNRGKPDVQVTVSGLQYRVVRPSEGSSPQDDSTVVLHCRGTLQDGTEFENTYTSQQPLQLSVAESIPGLREALKMMKPGARWQLFIPPDLGYGDKGAAPRIPPQSVLIMDVELLSVR